ncbi:hypothetical protein LR48_Vigan10g081700 [Vigna angularis]|uniref:DUF4378 domain-containing protein n=2 Tax=Phaseolus angularis TaxID=3914 RepID=A0A0L9VIN3_PHAAN|nr:uncharacterized protein LOC108343894 isoform X1 [Vigna angularis]KOM54925.1 hypothetical protein LR48_Vigan10g081700 [Vigna angularis]BAU02422.1 hypothetical protein VIGAN_11194700 [Vigna angularis var. angularis]
MGKEGYFAGRSSKKGVVVGGGGGGDAETQAPSGCMCAVFQFFDFHPFHFPNITQQQTSFKPPSCTLQDHATVSKGAEAPRNSLESEDGDAPVSSLSSKEEDFKIPKNIMQIKTSGGRRTGGGNLNDLSAEITSSPGTKTPTLVARLMGLDLLPGTQSPSFSSSSSSSSCLSAPNTHGNAPHLHHHLRHKQHVQTKHRNSIDSSDIAATRSLPETPRISLARRSDVDYYHHRFSLQINKENMNLGEDLELPRLSFSKKKCDENNGRSPGHYARQIVKQVKDSVGRKVGQDITNTLKTREEIVGQLKSKKSSKTSPLKAINETESSPLKPHSNTSSYSPRLRFIDKNKQSTTATPSPLTPKDQNMLKLPSPPPPVNTQLSRVLAKPKPQTLSLPEQQDFHQNSKSEPKCKMATNEKFNSRFKRPPQTSDIIRNKQEESFVIRPTSPTRASDTKTSKSKKIHPLSSNLLNNINTVPNLLPVKTDPSPPATKIPPKQSQVCDSQESKSSSQLSSCSRQRYKQEGTTTLATRETSQNKHNSASATIGAPQPHTPQELHYITAILARTTALNVEDNPTNPPLTSHQHHHWFSPTHSLDPSIFLHLEHLATNKDLSFSPTEQLGHHWNRKLLFDLVDEVLKEILQERGKNGLWFSKGVGGCWHSGSVVERVWKRVGEFPRAKCEVLEDIDGLIEGEDMQKEKDGEGLEEEGEGLVAEIEGNIWDTLVHETVMLIDCLGNVRKEKLLDDVKISHVCTISQF